MATAQVKPMALPSGVNVTRKNKFKSKFNNNNKTYRLNFQIPTKDDANKYYKSLGVLPVKNNDSIFEKIKNFDINPVVDEINAELDSSEKPDTVESSIYQMDVVDKEVDDFNSVFLDFRKVLEDNKEDIATALGGIEVNSGTPPEKIKIEKGTLLTVPDNSSGYIINKTSISYRTTLDKYINLLNEYYKKIIEHSSVTSKYTDDSEKKKILTYEPNREVALYIIGQVFNIIDPDFVEPFMNLDDPLLIPPPPVVSSSLSPPATAPIDFFKMIVPIPNTTSSATTSKISNTKYYYVGNTDSNGKKQGKGMIRWTNGNIFEGNFDNDAINDGKLITFPSGTTTTTLITNANQINMDNGEIVLITP